MGEFLLSCPALITQSFNHFSCPAGPVLINFSVHILTHTLYICKDMVPIYTLHMLMWTQWHGWVSPCNIFLIRISVLSIEAWWIIYRRCRKEFTGGICACVQPKAVISVFKLPWDFGGEVVHVSTSSDLQFIHTDHISTCSVKVSTHTEQ